MAVPINQCKNGKVMLLALIIFMVFIHVTSYTWSDVDAAKWAADASVDRCTTIALGAKAAVGGPIATHTADCSDCDFRISKVPAKDWPEGTMRPLYLYRGEYPSTISAFRGRTWMPSNIEGNKEQLAAWGTESIITGYIPQVKHTYALYEAGYAIMNEYQVAIGESTCAARFWAAPTTAGGKALLEIRELSRLALERTKTAKDAVLLMGSLAEQYGFYAADWSGGDESKGEGGEALTVVDKTESWVFHVLSDDTGTSAVWAAQRVPDDHIAAVANQFIIRNIDTTSPDFLYSANIFEVAKRQNLWTEGTPLDFLKTFAPPRAHSAYATRRVWRVFNIAAPSISLPPFTNMYGDDYPFSVKVDKPLTAGDVIEMQRDHYEGTQFDLTKGLAAGPYGDPNRFDMAAQPADNMTVLDAIQGSYERSISLFRTSYSFVAQARQVPDLLSMFWFSQYAPSSSSYVPLYVASEIVPPPYSRGNLYKYDSTVAFWNFCAVGNYAARFYKFAMQDVFELQKSLFADSLAAVEAAETKVKAMIASTTFTGPAGSVTFAIPGVTALLTEVSNLQAAKVLIAWRDMLPKLITKYHDGYRAEGLTTPAINMQKLFYPKWWLDATGYFDNKITTGPGVILFNPSPSGKALAGTGEYSFQTLILTSCVSSLLTLLLGVVFLKVRGNKRDYLPIR